MKQYIFEKTINYVQKKLANDVSGHDGWHAYRVWKTACYIAKKENADELVVGLAALLHDISDWKFNNGDLDAGAIITRKWLEKCNADLDVIEDVCSIIRSISFKGAHSQTVPLSLEGQIVQDADRLDALGAIGIARTFAYGGYKGRRLYDPEIKPILHDSFNDYKNHQGTTINHFYEKLLLLKDRMNTDTGKKLAEKLHAIMENFLKQFMQEWEADYE